jgi:hypothetical protein
MYLMFLVKRMFGHPDHLIFISSLLSSGDYNEVRLCQQRLIISENKTTQYCSYTRVDLYGHLDVAICVTVEFV